MSSGYVGRFAPSPTGPLHAGSLVAALASWLDSRAHHGLWLVRIEDVDISRCRAAFSELILQQLAQCGLHSDRPPWVQSQRGALYQAALEALVRQDLAYPCGCTRQDIARALQQAGQIRPRNAERVYPGTCRAGLQQRTPSAWRLRTDIFPINQPLAQSNQAPTAIDFKAFSPPLQASATPIRWYDRRLGGQQQDVAAEVGDFVLKRADGCYAYQLAVVVDDAAQGVTHVVRGQDLADNTARQIVLQRALGLPTPQYLHTPLVLGANGEKLSKQNGAPPLDLQTPQAAAHALRQAAAVLGLAAHGGNISEMLAMWTKQWLFQVPDGQFVQE